jgi:L-alanine-DL-glutamate epimerase-like enolase superfamily enzyme
MTAMRLASDAVPVQRVRASVFVVPTDGKESDGTLEWDHTTLVLVETSAGGQTGIGWTYADRATAAMVDEKLSGVVTGRDAMAIAAIDRRMAESVRNDGRAGVASMAMAAVDASLWDLKAKLFDVPLVTLLGARRPCVPVYGSGGFTSYSDEQLREQLGGLVAQGIPRVKMKVGREPERDRARVLVARHAIGDAPLFVDANGAYSRKQALDFAAAFRDLGVVWFEEPVSSDDLAGLRLVRDRASPGMDVAAGEYGYDLVYFRRMLEAGAVDVLQADASRCGLSGFLRADTLCEAFGTPLSAHCAPSLHAHVACAAQRLEHIEYFHDHVRIEHMLFDGALTPRAGALWPDLSRPGLGVEFRRSDARAFAA